MYCRNCGKEIEDGAKECKFCSSSKVGKKEKKPFYKKVWFWLLILFLYGVGSSDSESAVDNNHNTGIEQEKSDENSYVEDNNAADVIDISKLPIYSMDYLSAYVEANNIDIPAAKKNSQMQKALNNDSEMVSLKTTERFWGEGVQYVATSEQTELQYVGEMKDNKPHGWGRIMLLVSAKEYQDEQGIKIAFNEYYDAEDYSDIYVVLLYVGEFKDGSYDGYGWEYITPFTSSDDLANSGYARNLGYDYVQVENDIAQNIFNTCNPVGYMGEFKQGLYHGDGVKIQYQARITPVDMDEEEQISLFGVRLDRELVINVGEYKDGQRDGKCEEYKYGKLFYSGTIENGYYNKKGTLYYEGTTQKKYEGEWRTGKYHGEGTLYNEDGSISYKGEWDMGDYAH